MPRAGSNTSLAALLAWLCLIHSWACAGESFEAVVRLEEDVGWYVLYEVRFPSPVGSPFAANDTVWGHLYVPREEADRKALPPCVLVLPMMAAPNVWVEKRFITSLLRRRIAAFWLEMPYQFHRRPHPSVPSGQVFLARTAPRLAFNFRQAFLDARRAVSWLEGSGKVDPKRIGIFGISLGAMVAATTLSMENRFRGAVFLLGGADFPSLLEHSSMTGDYVRRIGVSQDVMRRAFQGLDPLEYRDSNRGKRVLLINANSDRVVPKENALALRRAFPDSRQVWVPFGHYSSMLHLIWVRGYVARQFYRMLRAAPPS